MMSFWRSRRASGNTLHAQTYMLLRFLVDGFLSIIVFIFCSIPDDHRSLLHNPPFPQLIWNANSCIKKTGCPTRDPVDSYTGFFSQGMPYNCATSLLRRTRHRVEPKRKIAPSRYLVNRVFMPGPLHNVSNKIACKEGVSCIILTATHMRNRSKGPSAPLPDAVGVC